MTKTLIQDATQIVAKHAQVDPAAINVALPHLRYMAKISHICSVNSGWWHDPQTGKPKDRNKGEMLALIHSEVSEALEGIRKNKMDDHLPHRRNCEVELADAMIRIFDFCVSEGYDIAGAMVEKLAYNSQRADHKAGNRNKEGGKAF